VAHTVSTVDTAALERLGSAPRPSWLTDAAIDSAARLEQRPFPAREYASRLQRVRERLEERGLDGVLVFRPSSVDYLCGHHTIAAALQPLLVRTDGTWLFVPDDEVGRALASATVDAVGHYRSSEDALSLVASHVARVCGPGARLALEQRDRSVPPLVSRLLEKEGVGVVDADYLVEELRLRLSEAEVACMERAAEVTAAGVEAASRAVAVPGATDSAVAGAIEQALAERSESSAATRAIVATGRRGGITHSTYDDVALGGGTTFTEFAGTWQRYHAPIMATFAREELTDTEARLERLAQATLAAVLREARPGRPASEVAVEVTRELDELTDADIFHFNFGYAMGLAHPPGWMDGAPFNIMAENHQLLEPGMAFHVPASFRCFGKAAVGLSHTIVIDDLRARPLTGAVGGGVIRL
jgi:Xaa-Pro dipeptidase